MGIGIFSHWREDDYSCAAPPVPPNPDPKKFTILSVCQYDSAYVLKVKYPDATNFEGVKVMVYRGKFPGLGKVTELDPHFYEDDTSPIARFRPDVEGQYLAHDFAKSYSGRVQCASSSGSMMLKP
jgi:hypothetical protein